MGIDRWKQEHRNWRPGGMRLVAPEKQPDEPAAPSTARGEKNPDAKPRAAKKQAGASSSRTTRVSEKAPPKRNRR